MGRKSFSFSEVLGFGWNVMKDNFWFFAGIVLVLFLIALPGQILSSIAKHLPETISPLLLFALLPAMLIIEIVVGIGLIRITLAFCDGNRPKFSTLFNARGYFWRYIGAAILYGLIIMGTSIAGVFVPRFLSVTAYIPHSGLLVLIAVTIMTVILSIKFSLCFYFVIDKKLGPVNALRASSRATAGAGLSLFIFGILCGLINLAGILCLFIGLFATFPMVMAAMALVYRQLSAQTPELAELGALPAGLLEDRRACLRGGGAGHEADELRDLMAGEREPLVRRRSFLRMRRLGCAEQTQRAAAHPESARILQ